MAKDKIICQGCKRPLSSKEITDDDRCVDCTYRVKGYRDPRLLVDLHLVSEGGLTKGWLHSHGLDDLGLPELEIRGVPLFLGSSAAGLLNHVMEYMLNAPKPVKLGEKFGIDNRTIFQFEKATPINDDPELIETHYNVERWLLSDAPMVAVCESGAHRHKKDTLLQ